MDHDAAHKHIYHLPAVVADLLHLVAPDWVGELDFANLEDRSPEFLNDAHRKSIGDLVFSVRLRRGRLPSGERPYLLILLEFQSKVDLRMAKRVRKYTKLLLDRVSRKGAWRRREGQPWVLPIVVYNGSRPWSASGQASDLMPLPSKRMRRDLALHQPQAYRLLVAGGVLTPGVPMTEDWPLHNRVSATVRLQQANRVRELVPRYLEEAKRFPGVADRAFRQALYAWAKALWTDRTDGGMNFPDFDDLEQNGEEAMTSLMHANWDRNDARLRSEARKQGLRQGRVEEGVRLISRQAALKFGPRTSERIAGLLNGLTEREDLDKVGDWIIECDSGEELLKRVSALGAKAGDGNGG